MKKRSFITAITALKGPVVPWAQCGCALVLGLLASSTAYAQPSVMGAYQGIRLPSLSTTRLDVSGSALSMNSGDTATRLNLLNLAAGYSLGPYLEAKASLGSGISAKNAGQSTVRFKNYAGTDLVGNLPLSTSFSAYGSVGYGRLRVRTSSGLVSEDRASVGAGLKFSKGAYGARLGYESLHSKDGQRLEGLSITGTYSF